MPGDMVQAKEHQEEIRLLSEEVAELRAGLANAAKHAKIQGKTVTT